MRRLRTENKQLTTGFSKSCLCAAPLNQLHPICDRGVGKSLQQLTFHPRIVGNAGRHSGFYNVSIEKSRGVENQCRGFTSNPGEVKNPLGQSPCVGTVVMVCQLSS